MRFSDRLRHALTTCERDPRALAIVVVLTVVAVYQMPATLSWWWFVVPLAAGIRAWPGRMLWLAAVAAALWTTWSINQHDVRIWPESQTGQIQQITGSVTGLPETKPRRVRFRLKSDNGRQLRLSWYDDAPSLRPGDCVAGKAKLETPHGSANPGLFDYEAWLWREDIDATGYIKEPGECSKSSAWTLDRLRDQLRHKLRTTLAGAPMTGVVEALTIGARGDISDDQWRVLRRTGTTHLVAISGLHIGLIAGWLFFTVRWLGLRFRPNRFVEPVAAAVAITGASGYAALAGWALPTERALIMVVAVFISGLVLRSAERSRLLAIAAVIIVALWPAAVLAPGFWLSFGAVAWLLYLIRPDAGSRWRQLVFVQFGLVAGLTPLTLWFFGQASFLAPLINAVLIPCAAVFVPLVLIASMASWSVPIVGAPMLKGITWLLGYGWSGLAWVADLPVASAHLTAPSITAVVLALLGFVWLFAPRALPARWLGLVLVCPAFLGWQPVAQRVPEGSFDMTVLDVGQGSANVILTANHTLVFDTGPAYRSGFDAGRAIVVPYLRYRGIDSVDALILSHSDRDHAGGAAAIRNAFDVVSRRGALSDRPCRAGQHWQWDGVTFRFVYPNASEARLAASDNARSCLLMVSSAAGRRVLLTGDIEEPQERRLLERKPDVAADVLTVPHHGSSTSASKAFLDVVDPRYAVISAGWHNRWHFPARDVIGRLQKHSARIADTATAGAVMLSVGSDIDLQRWRAERKRIWQRPSWRGPYNSRD